MDRQAVAATLNEMGMLLEIKGENPFRCNAFHNAARALELYEGDFEELVQTKRLETLKGIGKGMAGKITELATCGRCEELEALHASTPSGLLDMVRIPGFGPKKVRAVYDSLGLHTLDALEEACRTGKIASLKGFGEKTQEKILEGLALLKRSAGQYRIDVALGVARSVLEALETLEEVQRACLCGSLRRWKEVVKDVDILVATSQPRRVMEAFVALPGVESVVVRGETKTSVRLPGGIQADLRCVTDAQFPFALHYFTGSKEHNTAIRGRAKQRGLRLNEYGLFHGEGDDSIACASEEELFAALGLAYIPPELREDMGEVEAAARDGLPRLVEAADIRSIFHMHTDASDGNCTLEDYAKWAAERGIAVMAISDHSRSAVYAGGLTEEKIRRQHKEIEALNERYAKRGVRLLKGIESDILPDGSLDYDDATLSTFDFVIASVHSRFKMEKEEMTRRICRAIEHPRTTILGHPTGRLLLRREGYAVDIPQVIECARRHGVAIEINSNPHRLDLDWRHVRHAASQGVMLVLSPDAHDLKGLDDLPFGLGMARKGWAQPAHVLNCLEPDALCRRLHPRN